MGIKKESDGIADHSLKNAEKRMKNIIYQKILDDTIANIKSNGYRPSLLLHACCAPCSSYVVEYLSSYFDITLFYYNPNISPAEEYEKRSEELSKLVREMRVTKNVNVLITPYTPKDFEDISKGLEHIPEGGARCFKCYRLRLEHAAKYAKEKGYDFFTTTLSISPHKDAGVLNGIGREVSEIYGIPYLFSDFKKKNGYKRSCELSMQYGLYRQNYCGCIYSKKEI